METNELKPSVVNCIRATQLMSGCVVRMKASSGMPGYGNIQCVSSVCEPLDTISLYGHNQHYKTWDVERVLEYPFVPCPSDELRKVENG